MRIIILIILFSLPCMAHDILAPTDTTEPVAIVGSDKVSKRVFEELYQAIQKKQPMVQLSKNEFLDELVKLELGYLEAKRLKLDADPEINYQIKATLLQAVLQKEMGEKILSLSVTEKEMKDYYKNHQQIRASHILLRVPPNATPEQKAEIEKKIKDIYKKATKKVKSFSELAKEYSEDPSAKRGGDLDYFSSDRMVKPFSDAAFALKKVGSISPPVRTQFGWHIIKLTGNRSFKDADKNILRQEVLRAKRTALLEEYFASLRTRYKVETFPGKLK
ncbi:peptidylprolyl isomerase [Bdellovibrionota bacterium]